jgi:hypothetical protein
MMFWGHSNVVDLGINSFAIAGNIVDLADDVVHLAADEVVDLANDVADLDGRFC